MSEAPLWARPMEVLRKGLGEARFGIDGRAPGKGLGQARFGTQKHELEFRSIFDRYKYSSKPVKASFINYAGGLGIHEPVTF
jgi:hypothetical protein